MGVPYSLFLDNCVKQNQLLDDIPRTTEVILWFEHDRYDQTMLIYLLQELSLKGFEKISMVTINQYPGIEPFYGLGQLSSLQLKELYERVKQPISLEQIEEAIAAWEAYTSSNPDKIKQWIASSKNKLPFLKQALLTHLSYFPAANNGLNEVETLVLTYLKNKRCSFTELFQYISGQRINDGLSDLHFTFILNELMKRFPTLLQCDVPLPTYKDPIPKSNLWIQ
ncbi:DUF1835 domain-containing protein [Niallia sp. 03091]|uniref:DUF1835 domain-containing protein n=1 Tax=unclassified Niallia TaxID=2837522 RepID=UPI004044EB33